MKFKDYSKETSQSTGKFLRIKDGESVQGVFRGEIFEFRKKGWGKDSQELPSSSKEGSLRFRLNFVTPDLVAHVWEFGITVYNLLSDINADSPLEKTKMKITRRGSTKEDTNYTVIPLGLIPPDALLKVSAVKLNVLENQPKKEDVPPPQEWPDEVPHDERDYGPEDLPF